MTADENLCDGLSVPQSWVIDSVEKYHKIRPTISKVVPLGEDAIGYMSMIRRIHLEWPEGNEDLPKSVIIKATNSASAAEAFKDAAGEFFDESAQQEQMAIVQREFHNIECKAYELFMEEENKPMRVPLVYATNKTDSAFPAILMEDFHDCHVVDAVKGLSAKQIYAIMDELVKMHVYSITTDAWRERLAHSPDWEIMSKNFVFQLQAICENLQQTYPQYFADLKTVTEHTFNENPNWLVESSKEYETKKRFSVLVHGDLWSPQILWKEDDVTIAGIVDWQIVHAGSPVEDLLRILTTSTSVATRKANEKELLDYYHKELSTKLTELGVEVPITREELQDELKYAMRFGVVNTMFACAFWANSEFLSPKGVLDEKRRDEAFSRASVYLKDLIELYGW